jgi:hypothetical protein
MPGPCTRHADEADVPDRVFHLAVPVVDVRFVGIGEAAG